MTDKSIYTAMAVIVIAIIGCVVVISSFLAMTIAEANKETTPITYSITYLNGDTKEVIYNHELVLNNEGCIQKNSYLGAIVACGVRSFTKLTPTK